MTLKWEVKKKKKENTIYFQNKNDERGMLHSSPCLNNGLPLNVLSGLYLIL